MPYFRIRTQGTENNQGGNQNLLVICPLSDTQMRLFFEDPWKLNKLNYYICQNGDEVSAE